MRFLAQTLAIGLLILSPATAQVDCTTTISLFSTTTVPSTTSTVVTTSTVSRSTFYSATYVTVYRSATITTLRTRYTTSSSTSVYEASTRTLGGYQLVRKSCPAGPAYTKHCSSWAQSDTELSVSTVYTGTVTKSLTSTQTIFTTATTKVVKSTVTTGSPPTTATVTTTLTRSTVTDSQKSTKTKSVFSGESTYTFSTTIILVTTQTTSLASPTATATVNLFSLQVTDTDNVIDGYTIGLQGPVDKHSYPVFQNASTWRYYIDPASGFLVHAPSGNYLCYIDCAAEFSCDFPLVFVPDKPRRAYNAVSLTAWRPVKCEVGCGQLLQCWDANDAGGRSYLSFLGNGFSLGGRLVAGSDGRPVSLLAVGPTRGR